MNNRQTVNLFYFGQFNDKIIYFGTFSEMVGLQETKYILPWPSLYALYNTPLYLRYSELQCLYFHLCTAVRAPTTALWHYTAVNLRCIAMG